MTLGIAHTFRNVYKNLFFFSRTACIPALREFQQPHRSERTKDECVYLLNQTILALREWREPIDIIISFYALVSMPDFPLPENMKEDKFLNSMQDFYTELGKIPKETLFLYTNYPFYSEKPIRQVSAQMKLGKSLDKIGDTKKVECKKRH